MRQSMVRGTFLLLFACVFALSSIGQTTSFSYQGQLLENGNRVTGQRFFRFTLFDENGNAVPGATVDQTLTVTAGVFNTSLDFGGAVFPGADRTVLISVKTNAGDPFTDLNPRQAILSTPYSIRSKTSGDAAKLGGVDSSMFVQHDAAGNISVAGGLSVAGSLSLDTVNAQTQYNLGGQRIMSAGAANTFVGTNAGISNTTGNQNSFFGFEAGKGNSIGNSNSFFGETTGLKNTSGGGNSFFGDQAGRENTIGVNNAFFGFGTGVSNTSGLSNSLFGANAGVSSTTANYSSFFGFNSGRDNKVTGNSFFGALSGVQNTTGINNAFFGYSAGVNNTTGPNNAFFGSGAGSSNTIGNDNAFFGWTTGGQNTTGFYNAFFGSEAGSANQIGFENSFFGSGAGRDNTSGDDNVFVGKNAGITNTIGSFNTFAGAAAGTDNKTGSANTFVGYFAGLHNTASDNSFFGFGAGDENTTGTFNTFVGRSSGVFNVTGSSNSFFGYGSGRTTTASDNAFFGTRAGNVNTTGDRNAFFGVNAGVSTTTGCCNSFFGNNVGGSNTTGFSNAFFGGSAGGGNTTGSRNTLIGDLAATGVTTGAFNTIVGSSSGNGITTGSNNTLLGGNTTGAADLQFGSAIGANAAVTTNDTVVLGKVAGTYDAVARPADSVLVPGSVVVGDTATTTAQTRLQVKTVTGVYGFAHTDGNITVGSYIGGGASGAFGGWLGTQSNHKLYLFTNNGQPTMTVDTTGNVGVGTQTPASKLTVAGLVESTVGGVKFPDGSIQTTASVGSITGVTAGTGLTGGGTSGNVSVALANTAVAPGSYTNANITVDQQGRLTSVASGAAGGGGVSGLNGLTGNVTLAAGANVTITPAGNTLTIDATGGGSSLIRNPGQNNLFAGLGTEINTPSPGNNIIENSFFGTNAGHNNMDCCNAFFGNYSGQANTSGGGNTFLGYQAGIANTTGSNNTFVGINAASSWSSGNGNTFVGNAAGNVATTGTNNTMLGSTANFAFGSNNLSFATAIGAGSQVDTSNTVVIGKAAIGAFPADTVRIPGNLIVTGTFTNPSDLRLKTGITKLSYGLGTVMQLRPVTWKWKTDVDGKPTFGLIAQEVRTVLPELVETGSDREHMLSINYLGLVPVTIRAIQEQETTIERLKQQVVDLTTQKDLQDAAIKRQDAELKSLKAIVCAANSSAPLCRVEQ